MNTKIIKINPEKIDKEKLSKAGEIIRRGGLVAFPTETVYGLGGDALQKESSLKIYQAKGRPSDNPLIVHIADKESVYELAESVSEVAKRLMDECWPGPLTLVFNKRSIVCDETTGGLNTVAVRMPVHPVAREFIRASKTYIAAPSANISGRPSPTSASHVIEDMDGRIDMIIDSGSIDIGLESTIVDVTTDNPVLLRPGYYSYEDIKRIAGGCEVDPTLKNPELMNNQKPKAPGMKYRHYAPKGDLKVVFGDYLHVREYMQTKLKEHRAEGVKCICIVSSEHVKDFESQDVLDAGSIFIPGQVASRLFDILRKADSLGADYIYSESFEADKMGEAVMNRLMKAAGYQRVNC